MTNIIIDKLDETITLRLPSVLKNHINNLPKDIRRKMHDDILLVMAKAVHDSKFDSSLYLSTDSTTNTL